MKGIVIRNYNLKKDTSNEGMMDFLIMVCLQKENIPSLIQTNYIFGL